MKFDKCCIECSGDEDGECPYQENDQVETCDGYTEVIKVKMSYNYQCNLTFEADSEEEAFDLMKDFVDNIEFIPSDNFKLENVRELLPWEKKGLIEDKPEPIKLQTADCCKECTLNFPEQCLLRINQQVETCERYESNNKDVKDEG